VLAAASATALVLLSAVPASASGSTGWLRLAHLSPDTKQVDVTLTSLSGHTVVEKLSKVGYGDVSPYIRLPTGTYAIAMVPAGAPASTTPVVKAAVTVDSGKAETVAAMNFNKDIEAHVYSDDLANAASNSVRVRVLEASANHRTVSVKSGSTTIDSGLGFSKVSGYATVRSGTVPITVSAGSTTATKSFSFPSGSVHTLFVLDTAQGGLTVSTVLDSASAALVPQGSVNTGGGALTGGDGALVPVAALLAAVAAAGAAGTGLLLVRRPRRTEAARA
jgi:hypothetical protein